MLKRIELRIAGAGGHGIVFAGRLLGQALVEKDFDVFMTPFYTPAQRGGWSKVDIVVSDTSIDSPVVEEPDILVVTTQERYDNEIHHVKPSSIVIFTPETVIPRNFDLAIHIPVTAFDRAEKIVGSRLYANTFLVGVIGAILGLDISTLEKALNSIGARNIRENLIAISSGFEIGTRLKEVYCKIPMCIIC